MRPFSSIILATCALMHLTIANPSTTIKDHAFSLKSVRLQGSLGHSLGRLDLVQEVTCQSPNPDVSYTETTVEDDGDSPTPPLCASIEAVDLQEPTRRIVPIKFGKSIESERATRDVFPKRFGSKFRRAQTLLSRSPRSHPSLSQGFNKSIGRSHLRRASHQARRQDEKLRLRRSQRETREELWEG